MISLRTENEKRYAEQVESVIHALSVEMTELETTERLALVQAVRSRLDRMERELRAFAAGGE